MSKSCFFVELHKVPRKEKISKKQIKKDYNKSKDLSIFLIFSWQQVLFYRIKREAKDVFKWAKI